MTEREPTSPALEASDTIGVLYDAGMYGDGEPIDRLNRILSLIERHWDARWTRASDTTPVLATVARMRLAGPGTLMLDSAGNEFSATPGDYFWQGEHDFFMDEDGEPMILVTRHTMYRDALLAQGVL